MNYWFVALYSRNTASEYAAVKFLIPIIFAIPAVGPDLGSRRHGRKSGQISWQTGPGFAEPRGNRFV